MYGHVILLEKPDTSSVQITICIKAHFEFYDFDNSVVVL